MLNCASSRKSLTPEFDSLYASPLRESAGGFLRTGVRYVTGAGEGTDAQIGATHGAIVECAGAACLYCNVAYLNDGSLPLLLEQQLQSIARAKQRQDRRDMVLDCVLADLQLARDLLVG